MNKRKIIEIYITEDKEKDATTFTFERLEDCKEANFMMKLLSIMCFNCKREEDILNINFETKEE